MLLTTVTTASWIEGRAPWISLRWDLLRLGAFALGLVMTPGLGIFTGVAAAYLTVNVLFVLLLYWSPNAAAAAESMNTA
jgi:hypothetical protein